jgi:hypothetical protein
VQTDVVCVGLVTMAESVTHGSFRPNAGSTVNLAGTDAEGDEIAAGTASA